jgi:predicted nucleotidyltransferase
MTLTNTEETGMAVDQSKIQRIVDLAKTYGATRLILFGSTVKTPRTARDVDIACDGMPGWKLYELAARIEDELESPLDIIPLRPATRITMKIEKEGKVLI